jgi:hypothetical protein
VIATLTDTYSPPSLIRELHQFSVEQYEDMIARGTLTDEDHVELLEGVIVQKMPHNAPHDYAVNQLQLLLILLLDRSWLVRTQSSITFPISVPEPDIAIVPGPAIRYAKKRPTWEQAELIIEVSDSTLAKDRGIKLRVYAKAKVSEYWIVNLVDGIVEVYSQPKTGKVPTYRRVVQYSIGESIPVSLDRKIAGSIPVKEFLP